MTKFTFTTKFQSVIGVLCVTLLLIFASCVKEVVDNQSQFEAEKIDLLKAKAEMSASFKSSADAIRKVGKQHFGTPHNGNRPDEQAFLSDLNNELSRQNPDYKVNNAIRLNKVWNPKTESLRDFMSSNGVSENVIAYSNTLKEELELVGKGFEDKIDSHNLNVEEMLTALTKVLQKTENKILNDKNLTESEKLSLLASTTAGIELAPAWIDVYQDFKQNLVNRAGSWQWLRALGNAIITVVIVLVVVAVVVAAIAAIAAVAVAAGVAAASVATAALGGYIATVGGAANVLYGVILDCRGVCVFEDDGCYCGQ
jgi:hypothetical protein